MSQDLINLWKITVRNDLFKSWLLLLRSLLLHFSGAGNYFWIGGQNWERQIDGVFIEFGPGFYPRNKRSLKKGLRRIWTAFLSQK